ncbi:MAG: YjcQ family protein [Anaerovoracaceae bacterium]|jgi:hypothetical protein
MAKDDYDVVVFKILTYLYACLKRKTLFDDAAFKQVIDKQNVADEYLTDILHMMDEEGLITGLNFTKPWAGTYILLNDFCDMKITQAGIHYLKENSGMAKVKDTLENSTGLIGELIKMVL